MYLDKLMNGVNMYRSNAKLRRVGSTFIIMMAIFAAFFVSFWKGNIRFINSKDMFPEKKYTLQDIALINYEQEGEVLRSTNEDPQFIFSGISGYVDNICVNFEKALEKPIVFQLFFSENGSGFSEEKSIVYHASAGEDRVDLILEKKIDGLRLDIGNETGVSISLKNVTVNDSSVLDRSLDLQGMLGSKMFWLRFELLLAVFLFVALHAVLDVRNMYRFIFKYRWLFGIVVITFMTVNQLHGDSIYMYDTYVQQGSGSEMIEPLFGRARAIRSDEWLVNTSRILSSRFLENPYAAYNDVIRATNTINPTYVGFASIGHDFLSIFYRFFGIAYGFCFVWNARIVLSFLFTFELFLIITKQKKLISLLGSCMIICSGFFLWWNFPAIILWTHASLVFFYYFFKTNSRKVKLCCAVGTPISCANFVLILYPAWQVPMGYLAIAFLVWMIHDNWSDIKKQRIKTWILFGFAVVFLAAMVISYLTMIREYTEIISDTVYPGHRVSNGGYIWNKLWYYLQNFLYPFKDVGNPSEYGTTCNLFPIPLLVGLIYLIRSKKKDWLIAMLLGVMTLLLVYTSVGIPAWLSKITLLSNSTPERTADVVAIGCIYLLIVMLSKDFTTKKIPIGIVFFGAVLVVGISAYISTTDFPEYMPLVAIIVLVSIVSLFASILIYRYKQGMRNAIIIVMMLLIVVSGICIRPVQHGFDAIDSKPLALKIQEIDAKDPDQLWIADSSIILPGFSIACGAKTINSVNTYPNMELWKKLDPTGQYNEVYNRYEHISLDFTNEATSFELIQADAIKCHLAYRDFEKTGVKYIISNNNLSIDNEYVQLQMIYNEAGSAIYQVVYK